MLTVVHINKKEKKGYEIFWEHLERKWKSKKEKPINKIPSPIKKTS